MRVQHHRRGFDRSAKLNRVREAASAGQRLNIWTGAGLEGEILRLLPAVALVDRLKAHAAEFVQIAELRRVLMEAPFVEHHADRGLLA